MATMVSPLDFPYLAPPNHPTSSRVDLGRQTCRTRALVSHLNLTVLRWWKEPVNYSLGLDLISLSFSLQRSEVPFLQFTGTCLSHQKLDSLQKPEKPVQLNITLSSHFIYLYILYIYWNINLKLFYFVQLCVTLGPGCDWNSTSLRQIWNCRDSSSGSSRHPSGSSRHPSGSSRQPSGSSRHPDACAKNLSDSVAFILSVNPNFWVSNGSF